MVVYSLYHRRTVCVNVSVSWTVARPGGAVSRMSTLINIMIGRGRSSEKGAESTYIVLGPVTGSQWPGRVCAVAVQACSARGLSLADVGLLGERREVGQGPARVV